MQKIVELKIEETKAVVGGNKAMATAVSSQAPKLPSTSLPLATSSAI